MANFLGRYCATESADMFILFFSPIREVEKQHSTGDAGSVTVQIPTSDYASLGLALCMVLVVHFGANLLLADALVPRFHEGPVSRSP